MWTQETLQLLSKRENNKRMKVITRKQEDMTSLRVQVRGRVWRRKLKRIKRQLMGDKCSRNRKVVVEMGLV